MIWSKISLWQAVKHFNIVNALQYFDLWIMQLLPCSLGRVRLVLWYKVHGALYTSSIFWRVSVWWGRNVAGSFSIPRRRGRFETSRWGGTIVPGSKLTCCKSHLDASVMRSRYHIPLFTRMVLQAIRELLLICKHETVADACVESHSATFSADLNLRLFPSPVSLLWTGVMV